MRRAQQAGAAACVVVQTAAVWPFTMSDSQLQGGDIEIPSLMLKSEDGEALRTAILNAAGGSGDVPDAAGVVCDTGERSEGAALSAHAFAKCSTCAICQEEMIATTEALQLPCSHVYHEECLTTWLRKQHTCPTCRAALPTRDERERDESDGPPLPTWDDFAAPRGTSAVPSGSMFG